MEAIEFPQANVILAKDQPQYMPLPVFLDKEDPTQPMTACFKFTKEEIKQVSETGQLWVSQLTFGNNFQPIRIQTSNPFINHEQTT